MADYIAYMLLAATVASGAYFGIHTALRKIALDIEAHFSYNGFNERDGSCSPMKYAGT